MASTVVNLPISASDQGNKPSSLNLKLVFRAYYNVFSPGVVLGRRRTTFPFDESNDTISATLLSNLNIGVYYDVDPEKVKLIS